MVCNSCGRSTDNENANFCEYCGASTPVRKNGGFQYTGSAYNGTDGRSNSNQEPVSFGIWYISPLFHGIGFLVLLVSDKTRPRKELGWATLVYMAITLL